MSQHSFSIPDESGAAFRADVNNALQALASQSSGATEPATRYSYQIWADTTANAIKRRNTANSAWIIVGSLSETFVVSRASNTILGVSDYGKTFVATAGFTQTLDAVATLKDGWWCDYRIESGATVTFDPNASETIDGATTKAVTGPAGGTIRCDGSGFKTVGLDIVPVANGGTGSTTAAAARVALKVPTDQMGTGSGVATLVGVAHVNTTAVGNVGAGEDDLMTYSLPANSLSANGKGVRVTAWGITANNANVKTYRFYFGTSSIGYVLTSSITGVWRSEFTVFRTGPNTQDAAFKISEVVNSAALAAPKEAQVAIDADAETDTAAITIKVTGEATANNDIVQQGMLVEFLN
jgi:hypothetical protein